MSSTNEEKLMNLVETKSHDTSAYDNDEDEISESSSTDNEILSLKEKRDEIKEIKRIAARDTYRVKLWHAVSTAALLLTALGLTAATFHFLKKEEEDNFKLGFDQFSKTISDAAIQHQENVRDSLTSFSEFLSTHAMTNNLKWPFVTVDLYEAYAANARHHGHLEVLATNTLVQEEEREAYLEYTSENYQKWIQDGHLFQNGDMERLIAGKDSYHPYIGAFSAEHGHYQEDVRRDSYWPVWQYSPPPATYGLVNWNIFSEDDYADVFTAAQALRNQTVLTRVRPFASVPMAMTQEQHDSMHSSQNSSEIPHSFVFYPVHKIVGNYHTDIVAIVGGAIAWDQALRNLLPEGIEEIHAVVFNDCGQTYTFAIHGHDAKFVGEGDLHDRQFSFMQVQVNLALHTHSNFTTTPGHCQFSLHLYPSSSLRASYQSDTPAAFTAVVATVFFFVLMLFYIYDTTVDRRNKKLTASAAMSNAVVSNLFPDSIRERFMGERANEDDAFKQAYGLRDPDARLKAFMKDDGTVSGSQVTVRSKPLADLFVDTTVLFGDIAGFTAWSSTRQPAQVFTLLETIYGEFDQIAKVRRIFKVETVGDCYVAVCGLPDPRKDHAVAMARFARDIVKKMYQKCKELESSLGPDTGNLALRVGMHSGPVTAGVLRGERSRFQLFGDTMNTTARLETSSKPGQIHTSKETASLITAAGKGSWLLKRDEVVEAKGLGELETYWINVDGGHRRGESVTSVSTGESSVVVAYPKES